MTITLDTYGILAEEALREAFDDAGIEYNGAAFTKINLLIQRWADKDILANGNLDIGDYE
jgi:hypothetical protein